MDPITTAAIATVLSTGLLEVGKTFVKNAVEPPAKEAAKPISAWLDKRHDKKRLQNAVRVAFTEIGAPQEDDALSRYARNLGFDQLQAAGNDELRQEVARAALLMTEPDPQLVPDNLYRELRWPSENRPLLAQFLYVLRRELESDEDWGILVQQSNDDAVRAYLRRSVVTLDALKAYLAELLSYYGLSPDVNDATALQDYIEHIAQEYSRTSFLFIKPSGRRDQLTTEAELEAVFVPLQVYDPQAAQRMDQRTGRKKTDPEFGAEEDEQRNLTINEVLARHPVFLLRGKPGCGKTTLLRHLTTCFANGEAASRLAWQGEPLLPILIPLRNFGRFLQEHKKEYSNPAPRALREFIENYFREYDLELPLNFFRDRLKQGRCLVMLDGLDEVADPGLRAQVAQVVNSFVKYYGHKGNRFVLASRPKGYDEVATFLSRPVVCEVQPLTPPVRDELVHRLLQQFVANERQCRKESVELLRDIRNKERVDELSRNPLFCTTLVLVYKYRGTTLPERRVDVYQELVNLMLGFWETHREGVADVRELALMDGTGRAFLEEKEAVEAKERALINLADWMQQEGAAEVEKEAALAHLAGYFLDREGALEKETRAWAKGFLNVAHQRSGLFIEINPDTYAFSHQNFREYLAATAVVNRTDKKMVDTVLAHAADGWWEEVILLAAAHEKLSAERRELLLEEMIGSGHLVLAGRCAVDAGARLPAPLRRDLRQRLRRQMTDINLQIRERFAAGEVLDKLDWLPPDLHEWVRCPAAADNKQDLLLMKYPLTNSQYALFVSAGGYEDPVYWGGPESTAWQWRTKDHGSYRGDEAVTEPEYWQDARFGKDQHGYPVVGVSWYEAAAYAAWLTDLLRRESQANESISAKEKELIAGLLAAGAAEVRLPSETEWVQAAGGKGGKRFPWDRPQEPVTESKEAVVQRANIADSGIGRTSPVGMFPQGASHPFGLMDLAGNVWEWTDTWSDNSRKRRVLRGGSWYSPQYDARVAGRYGYSPNHCYDHVGFRLVSPSFLKSDS